MVDTWATSRVRPPQIGKERSTCPAGRDRRRARAADAERGPVVVEDEAMVGSRLQVVGGAVCVAAAPMLGAGASSPRSSTSSTWRRPRGKPDGDELPRGEAPAWSVSVGGTSRASFPGGEFGPAVHCWCSSACPKASRHDKSANANLRTMHGPALNKREAPPRDFPPERPRTYPTGRGLPVTPAAVTTFEYNDERKSDPSRTGGSAAGN